MKKVFFLTILLLTTSLFSQVDTEATVDIQPQIKGDQIEVKFLIPEGYHQTLQEDYFFIEIEEIEGVAFEQTKKMILLK